MSRSRTIEGLVNDYSAVDLESFICRLLHIVLLHLAEVRTHRIDILGSVTPWSEFHGPRSGSARVDMDEVSTDIAQELKLNGDVSCREANVTEQQEWQSIDLSVQSRGLMTSDAGEVLAVL